MTNIYLLHVVTPRCRNMLEIQEPEQTGGEYLSQTVLYQVHLLVDVLIISTCTV